MRPAFSFNALRVFLPLFQHTSQRVYSLFTSCSGIILLICVVQLVNKWEESMALNGSTSLVLNIQSWLTRATLDALGKGKTTL